jgi:hypothetical protein
MNGNSHRDHWWFSHVLIFWVSLADGSQCFVKTYWLLLLPRMHKVRISNLVPGAGLPEVYRVLLSVRAHKCWASLRPRSLLPKRYNFIIHQIFYYPTLRYQKCSKNPVNKYLVRTKAASSSEMLASTYPSAMYHNAQDHNMNVHYHENLKFHVFVPSTVFYSPFSFSALLPRC